MAIQTAETTSRTQLSRVALATVIGTTIEWYDFFIYGSMAGLVFGKLFFEPAGTQGALLLSFASVGISFLFRPLGAVLAGHFGDRIGRRAMLVVTLSLMGGATTLIGVIPTYAQGGVLAPVLLIVLRIVQGISVGGEWGGAILMAVEHAPEGRRGRYGAFPQLGVPFGLLLASGVIALMTGVISPGDAFTEWGWRVPFLISFLFVAVGYVIRRRVEESPVFQALDTERAKDQDIPFVQLVKKHWALVLLAALTYAGNNACGYITTGGFVQGYVTTPLDEGGAVGIENTTILIIIALVAGVYAITTFVGGDLSDRIGRKRTYLVGWAIFLVASFALFPLLDTGSSLLIFLALAAFQTGNGFTYGPQPAFFSELFPADIRYTAVAVTYALGALLGGAFTPLVATAIVQATGNSFFVSLYLAAMIVIAAVATWLIKDRTDGRLMPSADKRTTVG
ncbi:MFS transporter [Streptomyces sp. NPDC059894]|uniref:MFS transporter n=1 Tax=unclassified Streptomyces TaxID=2593676 RepID=UPI003650E666